MKSLARSPKFTLVLAIVLVVVLVWYAGAVDETPNANAATTDGPSPALSVGSAGHTCAIDSGGSVKCWGIIPGQQLHQSAPQSVCLDAACSDTLSGVTAVSAGLSHTCAITSTEGVKCWGTNNFGELGNNSIYFSAYPVDVFGLSSGVTAISAGSYYTCALTTAGEVKCWGRNDSGQLGNGTDTGSKTPVVVADMNDVKAISAGADHACALINSGTVKCWGSNRNGELGLGTLTGPQDCPFACSMSPVDVCADDACAAPLSGVAAISAGGKHTCALTNGGGVKCWGYGSSGQLGRGVPTPKPGCTWCYTTPASVCADTTCLQPISGIKAVSAGLEHTCALTAIDGVKCWGYNGQGELGDGTSTNRSSAVDVCADENCGDELSGIATISAGWRNTCAFTVANTVRCWGTNREGELGIGTFEGPQECTFACGIVPVDIPGLVVASDAAEAAPPQTAVDDERPSIVQSVPDPTEISTDPEVVGTNLTFAIVAVIVILLSAQVFNGTIEENNEEIERFARRYLRPVGAPLRVARKIWERVASVNPQISRIVGIGAVLGTTAIVYGFLEPGFQLNKDGILLLVSVIIALGITTYAYSGMEAFLAVRRFKVPAAVRVYPVACSIAVVSVLVSRFVSFQPGIVYGFVASAVLLGELQVRQRGLAVFGAAVCLFAVFVVAWLGMIPARAVAEDHTNALTVLAESSVTLVVVSSIQGLAFNMVPIEFMPGRKMWRANRLGWFVLAVIVTGFFMHVLVVQDEAGFSAMSEHGTLGLVAALGVCVGLTASVWGFFTYRRRHRTTLSQAPPTPAVTQQSEAGQE